MYLPDAGFHIRTGVAARSKEPGAHHMRGSSYSTHPEKETEPGGRANTAPPRTLPLPPPVTPTPIADTPLRYGRAARHRRRKQAYCSYTHVSYRPKFSARLSADLLLYTRAVVYRTVSRGISPQVRHVYNIRSAMSGRFRREQLHTWKSAHPLWGIWARVAFPSQETLGAELCFDIAASCPRPSGTPQGTQGYRHLSSSSTLRRCPTPYNTRWDLSPRT